MEIVVAVAAKIGEYLVAPIGRQLGCLIHYNRNIENLRDQVQKLGDMRHGVQGSVDAANRNGEEIKADVQKWLISVNGITSEVETFLEDDHVKFNKRCFSGRCPDWSSRYCISKEAKKKSLVLIELREDGKFESVSFPAPPPGIESIPTGDFVAFQSTESAMKEIMEALKDAEINIIGLYGMGGVGKTTLVIKVGKQAKEDKLFDEVVMVVVSQTQNMKDIQGQIADKLDLKFDVETEAGRADRLRSRLKNRKSILLILDDVWEKLNLEAVGIPFGDDHKGCKIILTTRRQEVCHKMEIQPKAIIHLNVLSDNDSWNLFRKYSGQAVNSPTLNDVAREVAKHCGGLPIALVTVGRALRDEDLHEWKKAALKLKEFKPTDNEDIDQEVFSCLKLSYDYVKGEETKSCFLLCCLFPEDHHIEIEDLARYGMGQGLFQNVETMDEARDRAHKAIKNLIASCLLLDSYEKGFVKMHDVVRHAAISIASKDKDMWVRSGIGLKEWPNKQTFKDDTVISLMYNDIKVLPDGLECPKLETLLLQGNSQILLVPEDFCKEMEALKVLDISGPPTRTSRSPSHGFDLRKFGSLTNLKTLHLKCLWFWDISILGELKKLEILSLNESSFKELPKEIGHLTKLRLLDLTFCKIEIIQPNVLSSLSKLEELYMRDGFKNWEVEKTSKRSNASPAELKSLGCLTILSMTIPNANCLPNDLRLPKLIKFHIAIGNILNLENCPCSKTMYLDDIETPSGDAIKCLLEITEMLYLRKVKGLRNILPDLCREGLNVLKSLNVTDCSEIQYLTNAIEGSPHMAFWRLEELHLKNLDSLRKLCHELVLPAQSFENLRVLKVYNCGILLNVVPANLLQRLQNLEELVIEECDALENVFNLEGQGQERHMLPYRLRKLRLEGLPSFEGIVSKQEEKVEQQDSCRNLGLTFPNLKILKISVCKSLISLLPLTLAQGLPQLEEVDISHCDNLEEIVAKEEDELEKVEQQDSSRNLGLTFRNLKILYIFDCKSLKSLLSLTLAQGLPQLKKIYISECDKLEEIVAKEEDELEKVEQQDSSRNLVLTFPNLKILEISDCKSLKSLLSLTLAQGLPQLENISINECNNLEEIVAKEEDELKEDKKVGIWRKDFRAFDKGFACFENLKSLDVVVCNKLRSLFSYSMARSLVQLEGLRIYDCDIMEEVVSKEKEGEEPAEKIVFPQLKIIELKYNLKLRSFCSGNFSFEWPSLEQVLVYRCPEMETFTATALGIQNTPKLKEIKLHGEKIHLMGDLNIVIQNWFKGKGKVDKGDESTSKIQEVNEDVEFTSESEIQEVNEDVEFTSESEIQEICYDEFTRDFLSGMESTSKFQEVDKDDESTSKIQEASSSSTEMNQRQYQKLKRWAKEGLSLRHSSGRETNTG